MSVESGFVGDSAYRRCGIDCDWMVAKAMNLRKLYFSFLVAMALGCTSVSQVAKPERREWPQKCEMCGSTWLVTPDDPRKKVPPTVEWCFKDGSYCEVGLQMIIDQTSGDISVKEQQWVDHCLTCSGCRCASFDPDEWKIAIDVMSPRK